MRLRRHGHIVWPESRSWGNQLSDVHAPYRQRSQWLYVSGDMQVIFLSASEEINKKPDEYWTLVMDIARKNNLKRIIRCSQIMGRAETEDLSAAQIFYPCMQCADIFFLKVCG
jgi:tyrosyl-tRNA synthetase